MILYNQNIWGNTDKPIGNRHILIREMVDEIRPDVVTLQECNPARSRVGEYPMQEMLKPEYLEVLPEKADVNFAPVFYRTETLEFLEGGFFPFEGKNFGTSKSATWAVFTEKSTGKRFGMISTHFWFKAVDETDTQQRRENAKAVCKVAYDIQAKYNIPVLVAGDLNSTDATNSIVEEFIKAHPDTDLTLYCVKERKGKTNAQNEAQRTVTTEFLVMTDANAMLDKNCVKEKIIYFLFL